MHFCMYMIFRLKRSGSSGPNLRKKKKKDSAVLKAHLEFQLTEVHLRLGMCKFGQQ